MRMRKESLHVAMEHNALAAVYQTVSASVHIGIRHSYLGSSQNTWLYTRGFLLKPHLLPVAWMLLLSSFAPVLPNAIYSFMDINFRTAIATEIIEARQLGLWS